MAKEKEKDKESDKEKIAKLQSNKTSILNRKTKKTKDEFDYLGYFILLILILVTIFTRPDWREKVSVHHVWYYGWITAISTGFGAIPFYFFPEPDKYWMGVSNGKKKEEK